MFVSGFTYRGKTKKWECREWFCMWWPLTAHITSTFMPPSSCRMAWSQKRMAVLKPSSSRHILRSAPWKLDGRVERQQPSNSACFVQRWITALPLPDLSVIASGSIAAVSSQDNSGVQGHGLLLLPDNAMPYASQRKQEFMDGDVP